MQHSHELRLHDYRKGINHSEILQKGSEKECIDTLQSIVDANNGKNKSRCGIGLYINNGGYSVVDLEIERIQKLQKAGPELFDNLYRILDRIKECELQNNFPSEFKRAELALKSALQ